MCGIEPAITATKREIAAAAAGERTPAERAVFDAAAARLAELSAATRSAHHQFGMSVAELG
jgi:hypothetical protein